MKITAIIPARSGSKRIPNKNIKLYCGKPLIYWSIKTALSSKYINEVIVSTDSEEIADLARSFGAKTPYIRPSNISQDLSTDYEFIKYHLDWEKERGHESNLLVQLRPTYPNREILVVDNIIKTFINISDFYDSLRTVCLSTKPPFKMYYLEDGVLVPLYKDLENLNEPYNLPFQLLPKTYWHNGYIDIIKPECVYEKGSITGGKIYGYIMNETDIDDIDDERDWEASSKKNDK